MPLRSRNRAASGSMFVLFSDLLFALVAALILILFTFLIQSKQQTANAGDVQKELALAQKNLDQLTNAFKASHELQEIVDKKLSQAEQHLKAVQAENDKLLRGKEIELAIAVDSSGSMAEKLDELKRAIAVVSELFPRAVASLRISVVAYRDGETRTFPLHAILDLENDNGTSLAKLQTFLDQTESVGGYANVKQAITDAMKMLENSGNPNARQLLMILGDKGPGELESHQQGDAVLLANQVRLWANQSARERRVLSLYAGGAQKHEPAW